MTTPEQIDEWLQLPSENQRLEFKTASTQFDQAKLYEYCVAIANEGGGHLVLGVSDKMPRSVVGTQAVRDPIEMTTKIQQVLQFRVEIEVVGHPDGRVVVVSMPSRPAGSAYHHEGKYLMRSGSALVPMSEDRLRDIFSESTGSWLEERSVEGVSAQQVIELLDTQTFFELLQLPYPTEQRGVIERLLSERLIDELRDGVYAIRRLGSLLLARRIESFPDVQRKAARVVVYDGNSKLETKLDLPGTKGYAVGFQGLVQYVMGQLPQNEVIVDALRTDVRLVPEVVIRELVANAMIHQDFSLTGASMMVEVYDNRVEISNPGKPIVPLERFIDGYQSRNERLADLMRRLRICEEKSSGIDRVVYSAEAYQLPPPDFRAQLDRTFAVIYGPKPFEEMDKNDRVRACFQHCALKYVMAEPMTNQTLRERFHLGVSKAAIASQIIGATIEAGLIKPDESVGGSRKFARYLPFYG